jgi:autotransporter-associated beta strand protein
MQNKVPDTFFVIVCALAALLPATFTTAADSTWQGDFDDSWENATNWTTGQPGAGDTAFFTTVAAGDSLTPRVFFPVVTEIGAITFLAGAPAFTIAVDHAPVPGATFRISGAGITNNSANTQSLLNLGDASLDPAGETVFVNDATAGNNLMITNLAGFVSGGNGGVTTFEDQSSAGGATILNNAGGISGGAFGGITHFRDNATANNATITNKAGVTDTLTGFHNNSTAGNATIVNEGAAEPPGFIMHGRGVTQFTETSDAGTADITNKGATGEDAAVGGTSFGNNSSAGDATIVNQGGTNGGGGGSTSFFGSASAGTASITAAGGVLLNLGGRTNFSENSTAANATLITNGGSFGGFGGITQFTGNASGHEAVVVTNTGGTFNISGLTTGGTTVGSIAGGGSYVLGSRHLTVGTGFAGAFANTEVSGVISGIGGSLTKTGVGTLSLSAANTHTDGTILSAGRLNVDNDNALGTGPLTIFAGNLATNLNDTVISNSVTVLGDFTATAGPGFLAALELGGTVNLGSVTRSIQPGNANFVLFSGAMVGAAGVSFQSSNSVDGAFVMSGTNSNTYGGTTTVGGNILNGGSVALLLGKTAGATSVPGNLVVNFGGEVVLLEDEQIANTASVTVNSFGSLNLDGLMETITALSGNGSVQLDDGTSLGGTLVVRVGDFDGVISDGALGGRIVKPGPGTLFLSGANTYTGGTRVDGGILVIDNVSGSATGAGLVTIRPGGELAGGNALATAGFIAGAVAIEDTGHLSPGLSAGTLTLQNSLTLAAASQLDYELGQPFVDGGAENDLTKVLGNLVLDGVLNISPFNFGGAGDYTLITYGGSLTDNGFSIGTIPPGFDSVDFAIDVSVLSKVILRVIPEPASASIACFAIAVLGFIWFRRRRK